MESVGLLRPVGSGVISLPASITIGIDPEILRFGHLHLGWYGVVTVVALLAGLAVALRDTRRLGFQPQSVQAVALWAVVGGFAGSRLFHVIDRWSSYADDLLSIFALQRGGLAIEGAIVGGLVTGVVAAQRYRLPVLGLADASAPGIILGQGLGRVACLFTGDALGGRTDLPWGVVYTNPASMAPETGVAYQPVFAYEGLWDLMVFGILWWVLRRRLQRPGTVFASYLGLYALGKFTVTFLRQERVWFWGLQEAHLLALALFAVAVALWLWQLRRRPGEARRHRISAAATGG